MTSASVHFKSNPTYTSPPPAVGARLSSTHSLDEVVQHEAIKRATSPILTRVRDALNASTTTIASFEASPERSTRAATRACFDVTPALLAESPKKRTPPTSPFLIAAGAGATSPTLPPLDDFVSALLASAVPSFLPTVDDFITNLMPHYKGVLTADDFRCEISAILALRTKMPAHTNETILERAGTFSSPETETTKATSLLPRSFILEQDEDIPFATILFNRLSKGDTLALPDGLGNFKRFKWGLRFSLLDPRSIQRVLVASQKASHSSSIETAHLRNMKGSAHIVRLYSACTKESKKTPKAPKELQVFEYCANGDLFDYLRKLPPIKDILKRLFEASQGLLAMHNAHLAHRDIKAENMFLTADNMTKVGDLGTSTYKDDKISINYRTDERVTALFVAPECARRMTNPSLSLSPKDHLKEDVWSFGITLLAAVTHLKARLSWDHPKPQDKLIALSYLSQLFMDEQVEFELSKLTSISSEALFELITLVKSILRINPAERPSMAKISADLKALLAKPL